MTKHKRELESQENDVQRASKRGKQRAYTSTPAQSDPTAITKSSIATKLSLATESSAVTLPDISDVAPASLCDRCNRICAKKSIMFKALPVEVRPKEYQNMCKDCRRTYFKDHPEPKDSDRQIQKIIEKVGGRLAYALMLQHDRKGLIKIVQKKKQRVLDALNGVKPESHKEGKRRQERAEPRKPLDIISRLPAELIANVFASLSTEELAVATLVSPIWHSNITHCPSLRRSLYLGQPEATWLLVPNISHFVHQLEYDRLDTGIARVHI